MTVKGRVEGRRPGSRWKGCKERTLLSILLHRTEVGSFPWASEIPRGLLCLRDGNDPWTGSGVPGTRVEGGVSQDLEPEVVGRGKQEGRDQSRKGGQTYRQTDRQTEPDKGK